MTVDKSIQPGETTEIEWRLVNCQENEGGQNSIEKRCNNVEEKKDIDNVWI